MPEQTDKSDLRRIAEIFVRHGVEFIVIGGQAETLYGSPRVTYDVDLCYERSASNLQRLAEALKELKPKLRGAPPDVPFLIDARALSLCSNFTFETPIVALDILGWVEPFGEYAALLKSSQIMRVGDMDLRVIGLDDLIKIKQHINRSKDRESLMQLLAIKRIQSEGKTD
jgi:predicted nucleotidyltransferase